MPELPEVEFSRRLLDESCVGLVVTKVEAAADPIVFDAGEIDRQRLLDQTALETGRYGKYFWIAMESSAFLLVHFGMTGFVQIRGRERRLYRTERPPDPQWPPKHWKLRLVFCAPDNDTVDVVFGDPRRLGRIRLLDCHPMTCGPVAKMGFDPIVSHPIDFEQFWEATRSRNVPLKSLLLDQTYSAGVGNWMADDILYHARLHPETRSKQLDRTGAKALYESIVYIAQTAVGVNADSSKYPPTWLFHCRWGSRRKGTEVATADGHEVRFLRVGGRTTAFVPSVQQGDMETMVQKMEELDEEINSLEHLLEDGVLYRIDPPLYHQPSDLAVFREHIERHQRFQPRLKDYLQRHFAARLKEQQALKRQFIDQYQEWGRRVRKIEALAGDPPETKEPAATKDEPSSLRVGGGRRAKVGSGSGDVVRSEEELNQVLLSLLEQERDNPATRWMSTLATTPPMLASTSRHVSDSVFLNRNHLLSAPPRDSQEADNAVWTEAEQRVFVEKYVHYPKSFAKIASFIPFKSTSDCILFYYRNKKRLKLKQCVLNSRRNSDFEVPSKKRPLETPNAVGRPAKKGKPVGRATRMVDSFVVEDLS